MTDYKFEKTWKEFLKQIECLKYFNIVLKFISRSFIRKLHDKKMLIK